MISFRKSNMKTFLLLMLASLPAFAGDLPDPSITPGETNPEVTQDDIQSTICVKGYAKSIRPPAYFTNRLKKRQMREYGYADRNPKHYEEDHLVALSIGGSPNDPRNLWPEPRDSSWGAAKKDQLEFVMYKMVCNREISLSEAQREMAGNWIAAWQRYVPSHQQYRFRGRFF
jgi:hypothetical protein